MGLNVYDYGFRGYDPAIGRWSAIDPLAENYIVTSPYAFVQNNPLGNREIDGRYFEEDSKSARQAARIEKRSDNRAARLERKADKLDAKGKSTGDLRERASELRQTANDVRNMSNDKSTEYKYAKLNSQMPGPATAGTGTNADGDPVVTMFTEKNMGNQIHETRHGGQHSRGEINAITQQSSISAEVSAYRAQYSWAGNFSPHTLNMNTANIQDIQGFSNNMIGKLNRGLLDIGNFPSGVQTTNITNINQVNRSLINNMVEVGNGGVLGSPNQLLWIYSILK